MLSSISVLIFFQWNNITNAWRSIPSLPQAFKIEKTTAQHEEDTHQEKKIQVEKPKEAEQRQEEIVKPISIKEINLNFDVRHLNNNTPIIETTNTNSSMKDQVITFVNPDAILQGVDVKRDFFYESPISEIGNNNYLELMISHSSLLDKKQSTLTVMIDDVPIKSIFLTAENENNKKIRIPLQKEFLNSGFHKITFNSHSVISDDLCLDEKNPANWVKIHSTSFVYLDSKELWARQDLLKDFPYPFVQTGMPLAIQGSIVIPDKPSEQIFSAALTLSGYLSSFTNQQSGYPIITESEWMKSKEFKHIIALGNLNSWNGYMRKIIADNKIQAKENELTLDNFILKKEEYKQLLLVSGLTDEVIQNKIDIIANSHLEEQLTGNTLRITNAPLPNVEDDHKTTLATIGFEDLLLDEMVSKTKSQFYTIPPYGKIQDGSYLDLMVKASSSLVDMQTEDKLDLAEGAFTLNINNIPYGISFNQPKEKADNSGFYHFQIPLSEQLLGDNRTLEINFQSNLNNEEYGCREEQNNRWVFIENNSSFQIKYDGIKDYNFKYWPAPYVDNLEMQDVAILIPENVNQQLLSQLSNLYSHILSRSINQTKFTIIRGEPDTKEQKLLENSHVIIMGNLTTYPFLQDKIKQSLVKLNEKHIDLSNYSIINETSDYVTWMEPSFWNSKKMMTVFLNLKNTDTYLHQDLLDFLTNQTEEVDLVVRNVSGDIFTKNMQHKNAEIAVFSEAETTNDKGISTPILVGFFLILIVGIVTFVYFLRKAGK